jgi:hypothetical protein
VNWNGSAANCNTTQPILIGGAQTNTGFDTQDIQIDDVYIFNRVLTDLEMSTLFQN